ncbi:MAG: hypothetical protein ACFFCO_09985 [Promethearchaeota archaeon]
MLSQFSLTKPDIITVLIRGFQGSTDSTLLWALLVTGVAAYFVILGWIAFIFSRRVHALCQESLFTDKEPRRRRRIAITLAICLGIIIFSMGLWGFTRLWDFLAGAI